MAACVASSRAFLSSCNLSARSTASLQRAGMTMASRPSAKEKYPPVQAPADFKQPEGKPLGVTSLQQIPSLITGATALALRFGAGVTVYGYKPQFGEAAENEYSLKVGPVSIKDTSTEVQTFPKPKKNIVLYEYEASPYCRKTREACSMLDLTVDIKPCPRRGGPFRAELQQKKDQLQFPFMEDPNTGTSMFESDSIIEYLFDQYGPGSDKIPITLKGKLSVASCGAASAVRGFGGGLVSPNAAPGNHTRKPLTLYGYEGSPFVKPVRELLTGLEIPHTIVYCARGSANRAKLVQRTGKQFQVPYIVDPNTGIEMAESQEICDYLYKVYSTKG